MKHIHKMLTLFAVTLILSACGGGGGGGSAADGGGDGGGGGTTTGKSATVAFSVISTAKLPAAVQGITLIALLPAGTSVATEAGSHNISSSALTVGSGLGAPELVYGTYSAAANKVKIGLASANSTFRGGEFARLTVSYPLTTTLTAGDFTAANTPAFPLFQATGFDAVAHSNFDLTNKLNASLGVTFN